LLTVTDLELRAGPRVLMQGVTYQVAPGDRVGLVGRNGAGKTTMLRVLAGEGQQAAGSVTCKGDIGYLPQDPRSVEMTELARDRILSARGPRRHHPQDARVRRADGVGGRRDPRRRDGALRQAGGALPVPRRLRRRVRGRRDLVVARPAGARADAAARTLSGGQRRRVELARILFSGASTLLLDEPTNHLDADSITWLRDFLRAHKGG
jgi:ATPase subunit of ABC transporter with duplicated ATPase domains